MDLRNYFQDAQEEANDNFFNYGGDDDFDGYDDGYDNYDDYDDFDDDDDDNFDDYDGDEDSFSMATGSNPNASTSQPYIVNVQNTSTIAVSGVSILQSYTALSLPVATQSPFWGNGANISITMGITSVTYSEFLYQSMNKPFAVGLTYYQASGTGASTQVLETLTLIQKDINGNRSQKTLVPTIDPYQFTASVVAIKFSYQIDGFTTIVIASVLAGTTAKLYFYPAETSSVARTLSGKKAVAGYGNPNIIKSDKLQLGLASIKALTGASRGRGRGRGRMRRAMGMARRMRRNR
jgi:hypothetical protein